MPFLPIKEQATQEVTEIISHCLDKGLSPSASISLGDVRKLMIHAWVRGYVVCQVNELEEKVDATR